MAGQLIMESGSRTQPRPALTGFQLLGPNGYVSARRRPANSMPALPLTNPPIYSAVKLSAFRICTSTRSRTEPGKNSLAVNSEYC